MRDFRRRRRLARGSVTSSVPGCAATPSPTRPARSTTTSMPTSPPTRSAVTRPRSGRSATGSATPRAVFGEIPLVELERRVPEIAAWIGNAPCRLALRDRAGVPAGARGRRPLGAHDAEPGEARGPEPAAEGRGVPPVHTGGGRRSSPSSSAPTYGPPSCSPPRPGCARPSGSRSSGATSTATAGVVRVERTCAYGVTKSYGRRPESAPGPALLAGARGARRCPRRLDVGSCSPASVAESSTCGTSAGAVETRARSGRDPVADGSTTCATRSRRGRSTQGYRSSSSPGTWARAWR